MVRRVKCGDYSNTNTPEWQVRAVFKLEADLLHQPGNLVDLARYRVAELFGRELRSVGTVGGQLLFHFGGGENLHNVPVRRIDEGRRPASGRHQARLANHLEARQLFGNRGNIGQEIGSLQAPRGLPVSRIAFRAGAGIPVAVQSARNAPRHRQRQRLRQCEAGRKR